MSLKRALESLPADRETSSTVRDILTMFRRHPDAWMSCRHVANIVDRSVETSRGILAVLAESGVLDFDSAESKYRYEQDTLLNIEIDRFVRRVDSHAGAVQSNVERFRQRYGSR
ncbi:MAG: hypothetical protein OEV43_03970 [Coriobacteriia bacterium]|nr:hypothetical protein [Coriobacteriia bacterium]